MIEQALDQYGLPKSEAAIRLLCMIAAHESGGFLYSKQVRGPALSFFQLEPASYTDVCAYAMRKGYLKGEIPGPVERIIFDPTFAAAIARIFILRIPEPLPDPDNLRGLARYAKKYWNTNLGKATPGMYLEAYQEYFGEKINA